MTRQEQTENINAHSVNEKTREVWLHGFFDDWDSDVGEPGIDFRSAVVFERNFRWLDGLNDNPILVHMHTVGGIYQDGMAIYDTIKTSESHVTIVTYAHARSMSSIILQAADQRILMPHAHFLIHFGTEEHSGNYTSVVANVQQSKLDTESMLAVYVERCLESKKFLNWTKKRMRNFLYKEMEQRQEWYFTPKEAIEYGFADGILGEEGCPTLKMLRLVQDGGV